MQRTEIVEQDWRSELANILSGGICQWIHKGQPATPGTSPPERASLTLSPRPIPHVVQGRMPVCPRADESKS